MLPETPRTLADLPAPDEMTSRRLVALLAPAAGVSADAEAA